MFEKYSNIRRTDRCDEANCRFWQFDAPNKEQFVSSLSQTHKLSTTKVRNFAEPRPLGVAVNQADGKQRNIIFEFFFGTGITETKLNRKKQVV
jgi:hypothetical protein